MIRWIAGGSIVAALVLALGAALYMMGPDAVSGPVDFADDLKGPTSPNLTIPFRAYALTPEGLLRSKAVTARTFGSDRVVVKTVSNRYLSRDFVFEIDVRIPADTEDLAYVGFGLGDPNPGFNNEPSGAFQFRIHRLPGVDRVDAAVSRRASATASEAGPQVYAALMAIGRYVPGSVTTFRIERAGNNVTLSMPASGASHTFELSALPPPFGEDEAYLFFGNSTEGTLFSNVRVRPRG